MVVKALWRFGIVRYYKAGGPGLITAFCRELVQQTVRYANGMTIHEERELLFNWLTMGRIGDILQHSFSWITGKHKTLVMNIRVLNKAELND